MVFHHEIYAPGSSNYYRSQGQDKRRIAGRRWPLVMEPGERMRTAWTVEKTMFLDKPGVVNSGSVSEPGRLPNTTGLEDSLTVDVDVGGRQGRHIFQSDMPGIAWVWSQQFR